MAEVKIIGCDDDYRWEEERHRVVACVKAIADENGFTFALVQYVQECAREKKSLIYWRDMKMKTRYRGGSNRVHVHFWKAGWNQEQFARYVPALLVFNEDCDLTSSKNPHPEWFDEVDESHS